MNLNQLLRELFNHAADLLWYREHGLATNAALSWLNAHDTARDLIQRATNAYDRAVDMDLVAQVRALAADDSVGLLVEPALRALGV